MVGGRRAWCQCFVLNISPPPIHFGGFETVNPLNMPIHLRVYILGKGPSIWDTFCHGGGRIRNNATGDVACDSYHLYDQDIANLKTLGASIEWHLSIMIRCPWVLLTQNIKDLTLGLFLHDVAAFLHSEILIFSHSYVITFSHSHIITFFILMFSHS